MKPFSNLTELLTESHEAETVRFDATRCLRNRLRTNTCKRCVLVCSSRSLYLQDGQIQLDVERCTNCMRCSAVCPSDALLPESNMTETLQAIVGKKGRTVVSCMRQARLSADEVVVPCFGIFSPEMLLYLGINKERPQTIFLACGCSDCENNAAYHSFRKTLQRLEELGGEFLSAPFAVQESPRLTARGKLEDRRSFLISAKNSFINRFGKRLSAEKDMNGYQANKRCLPQKTALLANVCEKVDTGTKQLVLKHFLAQISVSESCSPCPLCSGICPTGALRMATSKKNKELQFNRERCSGCGLCISFCKHQALTLLSAPFFSLQ